MLWYIGLGFRTSRFESSLGWTRTRIEVFDSSLAWTRLELEQTRLDRFESIRFDSSPDSKYFQSSSSTPSTASSLAKARSDVWQHFTKNGVGTAICKHC